MTEPLFPLDPAVPVGSVPAHPARGRPAVRGHRSGPPGRQPSLFDGGLTEPTPADLAGLLAGPGQVVRMGGTARVSVVVTEPWRAAELLTAFQQRRVPGGSVSTVEDHLGVRTAFSAVLAPLAGDWLRGSGKLPPAGFRLDGPRLRLWAVAAGYREADGYLLALSASDEQCWRPVGAALRAAGFPAELVGPRAGGPGYRVVGRRRLAALAELLGQRPPEAPEDAWPV